MPHIPAPSRRRLTFPLLLNARYRAVWHALSVVLLLQAGLARAANFETLDVWRQQVSQTRQLAENDAPAALREAQRLQSALPVDAAPADRARLFNLQSRIENYLMHVPQALLYARQAQALAMQHADRVGQAEADLNLALVVASQGDLRQLDEIVPHCMEMLEGTHLPELQAEAMGLAATMYRRRGLIESSVAMAMQALEVARHENDPMALAYAHWSAATAFSWSNRNVEARDHAMRMHEQARIQGAARLEAAALVEWGRAIANLGNVREAEQRIRAAIELGHRAAMPASLGTAMFALAGILHQQNRTVEALDTLDEVASIYDQYPHQVGLWWVLHARSEYKQALGGNGGPDAERALELAKKIGRSMFLVKSEQRLAALAAHRHNWQAAYRHTAQAARLLDESTNDSSGERMMMLAKRFEKEIKQRRLDVQMRETERQFWRRWMLTLLGSGGIILTGTLLFLWHQRRSHHRLAETNRQLQLSQDRLRENERLLRALAERNEAIREAERRHLAREVHDELGQMLNVVRLNLLVLDRRFGRDHPEMHAVVGTMLEHVAKTLAIARNIVSALHPSVLDAGVAVALEWLLQEFGKSTGIAHTLAVDRDVAFDEAQAMAVYRIVQESLTNVARHSGADLVAVSLARDGALYRLEISDNGVGFDVSAPRNHNSLGLIGMQERALMLGGRLELKSSAGAGVLLRMDFPIQREEEFA